MLNFIFFSKIKKNLRVFPHSHSQGPLSRMSLQCESPLHTQQHKIPFLIAVEAIERNCFYIFFIPSLTCTLAFISFRFLHYFYSLLLFLFFRLTSILENLLFYSPLIPLSLSLSVECVFRLTQDERNKSEEKKYHKRGEKIPKNIFIAVV